MAWHMLNMMVNNLCTLARTNEEETAKALLYSARGEGCFFYNNVGKGVRSWESGRIEVHSCACITELFAVKTMLD